MRRQTARPLRACGVLLALYVGGRVSVGAFYPELAVTGLHPLSPLAPPLQQAAALLDRASARAATAIVGPADAQPTLGPPVTGAAFVGGSAARAPAPVRVSDRLQRRARSGAMLADDVPDPAAVSLFRPDEARPSPAPAPAMVQAAGAPLSLDAGVTTPARGTRGLSGSAWLLVRQGSGRSLSPGGTLGGSQAGARLSWQPTEMPLFLTVRASAALAQRDSEIAPGIGLHAKAGGIIVEQRFGLDRGRASRPAVLLYGGFADTPVVAGIKADAFAQAGSVGVAHPALFADGALRLERPVVGIGRARLGAGGGVWGAAQPGAARVDVGPQLVAHLPIGGRAARLSAEYRVRVAGAARPRNGLTVTLGADF